ncbi:hypothetical protein ABZX85_22160 [Streptomyces sp. NPDC004539]|uniref:hypothetical protein n=1 Tax=Streptomyces sp. NPDC004539 TaxID=3154280 RepID=UPI0033AEB115
MTDVRVRVLEGPLRTEWFCGVTALSWVAMAVAGAAGLFGESPAGPALLGCLGLPVLLHLALRGRFAVRFDDTGVTVLRPWSRRRLAWAEVTGVGFRRLRLAEDDVERWAVTVVAGTRSLPLVTVESAVDADQPSREVLERHGRLFAPLARRGLRPAEPAERLYFDRAVGSLSVG